MRAGLFQLRKVKENVFSMMVLGQRLERCEGISVCGRIMVQSKQQVQSP